MKVAIFASAFHPHLGGVEELVRQLAHAYQKQNVEVIVLTHCWPLDLPAFEEFEGIRVYRPAFVLPNELVGWHIRWKSWLRHALQKRGTMREVEAILRRHGTEIIHVQCVSSNAFYALEASRSLKLPLVVTSQGERTMDAAQIFQRSPFFRRLLHEVLAAADYITACSKNTLDDLQEYSVHHSGSDFSKRARVVYNGISLDDFENVAPHRHTRPYILGIGRLVQQKGFDVLLRAFAQADLPNFDLLLAGDGEEREMLEKLIAALKLENRAHLVGRADRARTVALFKGCEFFVLPSRKEPQGIVNLEAMAAGKAVIASRVGGVPEIVRENETGVLVPPDDVAALATAMRTLTCDAALREKMGKLGRARAENFAWSRIAGEYLEIYETARNSNSRNSDSRNNAL